MQSIGTLRSTFPIAQTYFNIDNILCKRFNVSCKELWMNVALIFGQRPLLRQNIGKANIDIFIVVINLLRVD